MGFLGALFSGLASSVFKNIDFTKIAILTIKIIVLSIIFGLIVSYISDFSSLISNLLSSAFSEAGSIGGLNLGYFAGAVGLASFINNLVSSVYVGVAAYGSGIISILIFKYSTRIYSYLVKL